MAGVTFRDFQKLMLKRKRSVDDLVDIFYGQLDENRSFFERVMSCQWRNPDTGRLEDRGDVIIPYRSVLKFYFEELHYLEDSKKKPVVILSRVSLLAPAGVVRRYLAAKDGLGRDVRRGYSEPCQ
jgi:hypothetical protein